MTSENIGMPALKILQELILRCTQRPRAFSELSNLCADDIKLASGKSAARNRINQQRYRERQKGKLREYEQQVTTLNQRLTALELENRSLGDRNRLLERLAQLAGNLDEGQSALVCSRELRPSSTR